MAFVIRDRVKEGTTTVGTGDIALLGAPVTFNNFSAYLTTGDTTYYAVVHTVSGVDEWEVGLGTYNATTNTIERTAVLSGTNGTNPVNFSEGTKNVFMTYPADKALYYDADGNVTFGANAEVAGDLVLGGYIDLNVYSTEPAHKEGRIFYHNEYGALSVYNEQSGITLQVGQEEWVRVYNGTGSTILDGTPVYPAGIQGEAQSVAPADATTGQKARVLGVATHDIPTGTYGYATVRGLVSGLDTSGLMPGMPVYLGVDGSLTNTSPTYPYYPTQIGGCIVSDATNGYIYVSPKYNTYNQLRVTGNQHIDGNLQIDGDLTITGTQSVVSQASLSVDDSFIYMNSGNTIGDANTAFSGTGLDDATFTGHYEGVTTQTFYVRIDGVGTGTGGVDTFEWSLDNFTTTQATGVDCSTTDTALVDGISIKFNAATGHTSGDTWSGSASPVNVDSGTFSNRNTGETGVGYTHMGWFYDVSTNKFTFLDSYDPEPDGTIDLGHASVVYATIKAGTFEGAVLGNVTGNVNGTVTGALVGDSSGTHTGPVVGNVTGNADTATKLATARTVQLSGDVTGSATFDGSDNINIIATVGDDSHAHVIANVDGLQAALDAKADDATTITAGTGLTGGGDLSVNRTLALDTAYTDTRYVNATGDTMTGDLTVPNIITPGLVDGRDVSVDGAKLDGIEAGATGDQTAGEILTAIKTVDGAGSGLDADTLDGIQAGSFLRNDTSGSIAGNLNVSGNTDISGTTSIAGELNLTNTTGNYTDFYSPSFNLRSYDGGNTYKNAIRAYRDGASELYYNGGYKLGTTNTGVDVNGTVTADGLTVDTNTLHVDASNNYVGIRTSSPAQALDVVGNISVSDRLLVRDGGHTATAADDWSKVIDVGEHEISSHRYLGTGYYKTYAGDWGNYYYWGSGSSGGEVLTHRFYSNGSTPTNNTIQIYDGTTWHSVFHGGYHPNADKLTTARSIALSGDVTGSASFDGSANVTITATIPNNTLMKKGADIPSGADLNTYTTDGYYHQNANAGAAAGTNYPEASAGMLEVMSDGSMVYQRYTVYNSTHNVYVRTYYNGSWYSWYKMWHAGNDGSGSGLDADLLDGQDASAFAPVNGSYNNNFYANQMYVDDWFRTSGDCGLYFQSYGTGIRPIQSEGGQYGSIATYGGVNGWEGYSISGRVVFMHNNSTAWGIYDDVNNNWLLLGYIGGNNTFAGDVYSSAGRLSGSSDGVGAVGSYAFMRHGTGASVSVANPGATFAASALYYGGGTYSSYAYVTSPRPAGTWRCMGYSYYTDRPTVWMRIS